MTFLCPRPRASQLRTKRNTARTRAIFGNTCATINDVCSTAALKADGLFRVRAIQTAASRHSPWQRLILEVALPSRPTTRLSRRPPRHDPLSETIPEILCPLKFGQRVVAACLSARAESKTFDRCVATGAAMDTAEVVHYAHAQIEAARSDLAPSS